MRRNSKTIFSTPTKNHRCCRLKGSWARIWLLHQAWLRQKRAGMPCFPADALGGIKFLPARSRIVTIRDLSADHRGNPSITPLRLLETKWADRDTSSSQDQHSGWSLPMASSWVPPTKKNQPCREFLECRGLAFDRRTWAKTARHTKILPLQACVCRQRLHYGAINDSSLPEDLESFFQWSAPLRGNKFLKAGTIVSKI